MLDFFLLLFRDEFRLSAFFFFKRLSTFSSTSARREIKIRYCNIAETVVESALIELGSGCGMRSKSSQRIRFYSIIKWRRKTSLGMVAFVLIFLGRSYWFLFSWGFDRIWSAPYVKRIDNANKPLILRSAFRRFGVMTLFLRSLCAAMAGIVRRRFRPPDGTRRHKHAEVELSVALSSINFAD